MAVITTKKTFSLPHYIADRLEGISEHTGYSQSNLVLQALSTLLYRYEPRTFSDYFGNPLEQLTEFVKSYF